MNELQKVQFLPGVNRTRETTGNIELGKCNGVRVTNLAPVIGGATAYVNGIPVLPQTYIDLSCNQGEIIVSDLQLTFDATGIDSVIVNKKMYVD